MNLIETTYQLKQKAKHIAKVATVDNATMTNIQLRVGEEIVEHSSKKMLLLSYGKGKFASS